MRPTATLSALLLLGAGILASSGAAASGGTADALPPACVPSLRGAEACLAGSVCTCDWFRGGLIAAEPRGWRWDCRIERMCGTPPADDGAAGATEGDGPPGPYDPSDPRAPPGPFR